MQHQQTAIITGASTGIGETLAKILAHEGYHLGLIARRQNLLEKLKKEITTNNPHSKVLIASCDVANDQQCRQIIHDLSTQLGHLDLFVANAGIGFPTPAWESNWNEIKKILSINLIGAIASLEAAKEIMLEQKSGHLVGISSVAAIRGLPATSAYCTSKAALSTYLESIRPDLIKSGIDVTTIQPGFIDTPMTKKNKYMPFLLSTEKGTQKIWKAIQKKKACYTFPWQMKFLTIILQYLPDCVFNFLMSLRYKTPPIPDGVIKGANKEE